MTDGPRTRQWLSHALLETRNAKLIPEGLVAQLDQPQSYHDRVTDRVILFLQTGDRALFPFTAEFDDAKMTAFVHDLRDALSSLTDSGSARKTSAAGFVVSDQRILDVIGEWERARGDWPAGTNPSNPDTALGIVRR